MRNPTPTLRLVFDVRNQATKTHATALSFVITFKRQRRYIYTGVKLCSHQWNSTTQSVVSHADAPELNRRIEAKRRYLLDLITKHETSPHGFDLDVFLSEASHTSEKEKVPANFVDFALERMQCRGLHPATIKQHKVAINALEEFGHIVTFKDLTPANILDFDSWLRQAKGVTHQATLYGYHKRIKVYINEAISYGYLQESPYQKVNIPRGEHQKIRYLIQSELDALKGIEIADKSLDKVRKLFILQTYTGLSYSDMFALDFRSAERRSDGRYYIRQSRIKTNEEYFLVLLPPAVEVLDAFGWVLPAISNQKYNAYLKGLGIACGISKPLTSHVARHTFATTITLSNKVPIEIVAKMMGHSDIKTTQRYARVLADDVIDAFKDLEGKI